MASQSGLETYLFGSAATLLIEDVFILVVWFVFVLLMVVFFWKELKCLTFDSEFFISQGFSKKIVESMLTLLIVITIVLGLQLVGVVLMSSLLIAPAVAARQWTDRLSIMLGLAMLISLMSTTLGVLLSSLGVIYHRAFDCCCAIFFYRSIVIVWCETWESYSFDADVFK